MGKDSSAAIPSVELSSTVLDGYLLEVRSIVDGWEESRGLVRRFDAGGDPAALLAELPIKVGPGAQSKVILRKNTYAELGNPAAGSSAFFLWSQDGGMLRDGRVTLVGPDIREAGSESLAFAQVLMVAGRDLSYTMQSRLEQLQYVSDRVEGYMIRSAPGRIWSRVSREVIDKGFGFEMLGRALTGLYKQEMREIEAMELLFVTAGRSRVEQLGRLGEDVRAISDELLKKQWLDLGFDLDNCMEHDCASCVEKADCDDVREVVQLAQKARREKKRQRNAAEETTGGLPQ